MVSSISRTQVLTASCLKMINDTRATRPGDHLRDGHQQCKLGVSVTVVSFAISVTLVAFNIAPLVSLEPTTPILSVSRVVRCCDERLGSYLVLQFVEDTDVTIAEHASLRALINIAVGAQCWHQHARILFSINDYSVLSSLLPDLSWPLYTAYARDNLSWLDFAFSWHISS